MVNQPGLLWRRSIMERAGCLKCRRWVPACLWLLRAGRVFPAVFLQRRCLDLAAAGLARRRRR